MGISSKLDEGRIYRFVIAALRMRRLQKNRRHADAASGAEILESEIAFDTLLEGVINNIDLVDTERVIQKLEESQ